MTPEDVLVRLDAPLSPRRRLGYVVLALAGLTASTLIGLLWATEPGLPARTRAAFAVLVLIGLCWTVFGVWAVTRRAPLYARDRVVAGWIGLGAWLTFSVGALLIAGAPVLVVVVALGLVAGVNLMVARRARAVLLRRRAELDPAPPR